MFAPSFFKAFTVTDILSDSLLRKSFASFTTVSPLACVASTAITGNSSIRRGIISPLLSNIVLNELDALANIDFEERIAKDEFRQLELVRIGTCGGLQPDTPVGTFLCSRKSIGFDGLLNFYAGRNAVCDLSFERAFVNHMGWSGNLCAPAPYVVDADEELADRISGSDVLAGITISANGFFGPQGRELRLPLADPHQNEKIESFEYQGLRITNFEMESSALAGLSRLMGHKAVTVCMVIANRRALEADTGYKHTIEGLIKVVLERL